MIEPRKCKICKALATNSDNGNYYCDEHFITVTSTFTVTFEGEWK